MEVIEIKETESTNSWLAARAGEMMADTLVYAIGQTAGRGQRGNSWESEPGMNLTASALLHPEGIEPCRQFLISEGVALAVCDLLSDLGVETMVKWPNDIYAGDRKICGILIEHAIMPKRIMHTIAGAGININQTVFLSDAPNPVSVKQLTDREYDIPEVAAAFAAKLEARMRQVMDEAAGGARTPESDGNVFPDSTIHKEFMNRLWRGDGRLYPFFDRKQGERIEAKIADVAADGILSLETSEGDLRRYAFKEVEFIL